MSPAVETVVKAILYLAIVLFASPLLEGVMRKVRALIHSRQGPPVIQPYFDLAKLLVKEDLTSQQGSPTRFAPSATFASVLVASLFVPFAVAGPASAFGDIFVFIYLMTLSSAIVMVGGLAQSSPYSHMGSSREMMMVLTTEAVTIISLLVVAITGHSALFSEAIEAPFRLSFILALVCYLFAMQAMLGKIPFDVSEADQEIMGGPCIEYSGPSLALFKWSFYMKQMIFGSLFFSLFVGWPRFRGGGLVGLLGNLFVTYGLVLVLCLLVALIDATNPRLRIDQSMRFFGVLIAIACLSLGLAAAGW